MIGGWFAMWGGMLFVITMVGACYYTVIYVALPLRNDFDPFFWNCLAFFIIFMICLHLFLFQNFSKYNSVSYWQRQSCVADLCRSPYEIQQTQQVDHVTGVVMKLDSDGKLVKNGKFCIDCNKEAPLRSHHCPLCKMCVIRKDHHCFVTSGCVGLGNQRFFITFLFWVVVGLCIVIRYLGEYMITIDNNFIPWGWTRLFGPFAIIQWMMNYTDLRTAASATLLCFCVASLLGSLGFLGMQLYYTYYGYTMYEYHSAMMRDAFEGDGDNVGERFRLVFGKYWYLNFIVPLVWEMPILTPQIATNLFRVGFLYIFNLIVGTGALALPKAFQTAGWGLSIIVLLISCLVSYISSTFIIESLSVANAVGNKEKHTDVAEYDDVAVTTNGPSIFEITDRVELSQMASLFLGRVGVIFSYIVLNVYLFGDLAIYSTTVPKSMMNLICASVNNTLPNVTTHSDPCHVDWPTVFDRFSVYRICVLLFIMVCIPMVLAGITKTKYLQLATTISRWTAFTLMIILATTSLIEKGTASHPPAVNIHGFGSLFGVTVYAFMCHHSLPGLITPMSSKSHIFSRLSVVYGIVLLFYLTLSITGAFAFAHVMDVYTLNFLHDDYTSIFYFFCDHFLALFPIFTLTTNYPIVAITLINNVKVLKNIVFPVSPLSEQENLLDEEEEEEEPRSRNRSFRNGDNMMNLFEILVPVLIIGLPTLISLSTDNVLLLASVTGSYPGVGVQFIIPCWLVIRARQTTKNLNYTIPKKNASPFQSKFWPLAIFCWAGFSIIMVTINVMGLSI